MNFNITNVYSLIFGLGFILIWALVTIWTNYNNIKLQKQQNKLNNEIQKQQQLINDKMLNNQLTQA